MTSLLTSSPAPSTHNWPRWATWAGVAAIWTIPGLAALSYYYLNQTVTGQPIAWLFGLVSTLPNWYFWALLTPGVIFLARRYPLERGDWRRPLFAVHLPAMVLAILLHSLANLVLFRTVGIHDTISAELYRVHIMTRIHANVLTYWTILGVYQAVVYYNRLRAQEQEAVVLHMQLAEAHLRALKMQLHPHFLFNTLNSIAALVRKADNKVAVRMIVRLSEFLRLALEHRGVQEVTLDQEIDFARRYLAIEEIRLQDTLSIDVQIDPAVAGCYVPNFLLQPIVENAIHHGIGRRQGTGGTLTISAHGEKGFLTISVIDNGPGQTQPTRSGTGVGLSTTRQRLERLYGSAAGLEMTAPDEGGFQVKITLPALERPILTSSLEVV